MKRIQRGFPFIIAAFVLASGLVTNAQTQTSDNSQGTIITNAVIDTIKQNSPSGGPEGIPDEIKSGELGYTIGCSLAASMNIPSCGELPSGKQFMQDAQDTQDAADISAAQAAVLQAKADAGDISTSAGEAVQNLQQQDSSDSGDTSGALAMIQQFQQVKQAADDLAAATPDPPPIVQVQPLIPNQSTFDDSEFAAAVQSAEFAAAVQSADNVDSNQTDSTQPDSTARSSATQQVFLQALQNLSSTIFNITSKRSGSGLTQSQGPEITPNKGGCYGAVTDPLLTGGVFCARGHQ